MDHGARRPRHCAIRFLLPDERAAGFSGPRLFRKGARVAAARRAGYERARRGRRGQRLSLFRRLDLRAAAAAGGFGSCLLRVRLRDRHAHPPRAAARSARQGASGGRDRRACRACAARRSCRARRRSARRADTGGARRRRGARASRRKDSDRWRRAARRVARRRIDDQRRAGARGKISRRARHRRDDQWDRSLRFRGDARRRRHISCRRDPHGGAGAGRKASDPGPRRSRHRGLRAGRLRHRRRDFPHLDARWAPSLVSLSRSSMRSPC